jgi:hypothetical protein
MGPAKVDLDVSGILISSCVGAAWESRHAAHHVEDCGPLRHDKLDFSLTPRRSARLF